MDVGYFTVVNIYDEALGFGYKFMPDCWLFPKLSTRYSVDINSGPSSQFAFNVIAEFFCSFR